MGDISYLHKKGSSIRLYFSQDDFDVVIRSLDFYKYLIVNFYDLKLDTSKKKELLEKVDFTAQMIYSVYFDNFQKEVLTFRNNRDIL